MNVHQLRQCAAILREVPLEDVLILWGAVRDRYDRSKWHTENGPVSVSGQRFMNWELGRGGGGAIDLVMHLADRDFSIAVQWLEQHFAFGRFAVGYATTSSSRNQLSDRELTTGALQLPARNDCLLGRVLDYLTRRRHLAASLLEPLVQSGKLYADGRGNAVFLLVAGKANRPVGAELRGTGPRTWRGLAPGSRKDLGYFWIGVKGSKKIVLCESAIDAISCFQIHRDRICISTSGVRADPPWLGVLIARSYQIECGFDADAPGDAMANQLMALHPSLQRLRPPCHDWNDVLAAER